ncbi:MAG: bifunctional demethylmenaquinone methyltransferase/2-methoxy-6-polyprenyl-1,4-benzoquinol methylase UbiE [bacterium]|nr:bifunctional demethylmenaquinone methyltransferase/2-methoxy-6-polyprenyl-1,4-benzoquinol methylase UbiE [bacterium]
MTDKKKDEKETETVSFGFKEVPAEERQKLVGDVFSNVAGKYDLMNDAMSLGVHRLWKRDFVRKAKLRPGMKCLDVAGGTGDIAMLMAKEVGDRGRVTVFDINKEMLDVGVERVVDKGFVGPIKFVQGNAEDLPFEDETFDVATVSFGIRNVTRIEKAFKEMTRVVKPGGKVMCLEFSHPTNPLFSKVYDFFSFNVIPEIGGALANDKDSYRYLVESIRKFPEQEKLKKIFEEHCGLYKVKYYNLTNGIAAIHIGYKI